MDLDPDVERFEVIRHEENRGGNSARSTGIEVFTGEFVAFLDDEWDPRKTAMQVATFEQSSDSVGVVYTGV